MPHYLTNQNRSLFLENYEYSVFDLRKENSVSIRVFSNTMRGQILYGKSILDLIERFTEYSGRMKALPDWLNNGAIVGLQGGTSTIKKIHEQLWMADFGEALPFTGVIKGSLSASSYHNQYCEEWARLNQEVTRESGQTDLIYFNRSGFTKSPGYNQLFWEGDQTTTWDEYDGFKSALQGLIGGIFWFEH